MLHKIKAETVTSSETIMKGFCGTCKTHVRLEYSLATPPVPQSKQVAGAFMDCPSCECPKCKAKIVLVRTGEKRITVRNYPIILGSER